MTTTRALCPTIHVLDAPFKQLLVQTRHPRLLVDTILAHSKAGLMSSTIACLVTAPAIFVVHVTPIWTAHFWIRKMFPAKVVVCLSCIRTQFVPGAWLSLRDGRDRAQALV